MGVARGWKATQPPRGVCATVMGCQQRGQVSVRWESGRVVIVPIYSTPPLRLAMRAVGTTQPRLYLAPCQRYTVFG